MSQELSDGEDGESSLADNERSSLPSGSEDDIERPTEARCTTLEEVQGGLSVRVNSVVGAPYTFSYMFPKPSMPKLLGTDTWSLLCGECIDGDHVRLQELKKGEDFNQIRSILQNSSAVVVILVLADDEDVSRIAGKVLEAADDPTCSNTFTVVNSSVGKDLREIVSSHSIGDVQVKFTIESGVDTFTAPSPSVIETPKPKDIHSDEDTDLHYWTPTTEGISESENKKQKRDRKESKKKELAAAAELHRLLDMNLFENEVARSVTQTPHLFHTLSAFDLYEKSVSTLGKGKPPNCKDALNTLHKHVAVMFDRDFPVHLIVAHRMHKNRTIYEPIEMLQSLIAICIHKMETLNPEILAENLENFLQRADSSYKTTLHSEVTPLSLLAESCKEFMDYQEAVKPSQQRRPLYDRIMWTSVALMCQNKPDVQSQDIWDSHIEYFCQNIPVTLKDLVEGMKLFCLLHTPNELMMSPEQVVDCLRLVLDESMPDTPDFSILCEFVIGVRKWLSSEDYFRNIIHRLRVLHKPATQCDEGRSPDKMIELCTLQQGVCFLSELVQTWEDKKWNSNGDEFDQECWQWLELLLEPIDVRQEGAEQFLSIFINSQEKVATKYRTKLKHHVKEKIKQAKLPVRRFVPFFQKFWMFTGKDVETYLDEYELSKQVTITNPSWETLLQSTSERYRDPEKHSFLIRFLKQVSLCYKNDGRANKFIRDLLTIKVPHLFGDDARCPSKAATEFHSFLRSFIQENQLGRGTVLFIPELLKLVLRNDVVHQVILSLIQEEFQVHCQIQTRESIDDMCAVLKSVKVLLCAPSPADGTGTVKKVFSWSIVTSVCATIPVSAHNLDWIVTFSTAVFLLGDLYYNHCCKWKMNPDFSATLPTAEDRNLGIEVFLKWVDGLCNGVICHWKELISKKEVNFDDILNYANYAAQIDRVADGYHAKSSVIPTKSLDAARVSYLELYEQLNILLLRYVPGKLSYGCCKLEDILEESGVVMSPLLSAQLREWVVYPGDTITHDLQKPCNPSFNKRFEMDKTPLSLSNKLTWKNMEILVRGLRDFLSPIRDNIEMCVFFHLQRSKMFQNYLKHFIQESESEEQVSQVQGRQMEHLQIALEKTKSLLDRLIEGNAVLAEITVANLDLSLINIEREFDILITFSSLGKDCKPETKGLDGVKNLLLLLKVLEYIQHIQETCEQYQLDQCIQDPQLRELVDIAGMHSMKAEITQLQATETMQRIERILLLNSVNEDEIRKLELFSAINKSPEFYQFIQDNGFVGKEGQVCFSKQYQLVTAQLEHEEYNDMIMNDLYTAFKLITPFMDTVQDFSELVERLSKLQWTINTLKALETVNRNISLITLWFSRAEGDTVANVTNQLGCILESGCYMFQVRRSSGGHSTVEVSLQYHFHPKFQFKPNVLQQSKHADPVSSSLAFQSLAEEEKHSEVHKVPDKWNSEQIGDFVRRLGFVDASGEMGKKVKLFQQVNERASRLLHLLLKLNELGHPDYLTQELTLELKSPLHSMVDASSQWNTKVAEIETQLQQWTGEISSLQTQYKWLLYFTIPKVLNIGRKMDSVPPVPLAIVQEISFLFRSDAREQLFQETKDYLSEHQARDDNKNSMFRVGCFMDHLLQNPDISTLSFPNHYNQTLLVLRSRMPSHTTVTLHSAIDFNQAQIIQLMLSIYDGIPGAYEVFRCLPTTTEEHLLLFLKRTEVHPSVYLVLGINFLPYQLQELLLKERLDLQQRNPIVQSCVHLLETKASVMHQVPWIEVRQLKDLKSEMITFQEAKNICEKWILQPENITCFELVYGHPGDGKTHYIKQQLQMKCRKKHTTVVINEAFSILTAIQSLQLLPMEEEGCGIFFNFTMVPPGESVDRREQHRYEMIIDTVGWFLCELFLLGYVEDPNSGESFRFPGALKWYIYIEVPSISAEKSPDELLNDFQLQFPVLHLLGNPHKILSDAPFDVDDAVQLVCKYLRAYDSEMIDAILIEEPDFSIIRNMSHMKEHSVVGDSTDSEGDMEIEVLQQDNGTCDSTMHAGELQMPEPLGLVSNNEDGDDDGECAVLEPVVVTGDYTTPVGADEPEVIEPEVDANSTRASEPKMVLINPHVLINPRGMPQWITKHVIRFSNDPFLSDEECHLYLNKYMQPATKKGSKSIQKLFISKPYVKHTTLDHHTRYEDLTWPRVC